MSVAQLPDELLISVFERLSLKERHRALPLVSRRCWQLVRSPQLLRTLDVMIRGRSDQAMPRLRSLARFLVKHGAGHVQQLRLDSGICGIDSDSKAECAALVACAATACSGLQELEIVSIPTVTLSSWLLPLGSSLRRLRVAGGSAAVVAGSLEFLAALQVLELDHCSDGVARQADACMPPSITRLVLDHFCQPAGMPPQIGSLRHLRHLRLRHPPINAASYEPLTRLSQLHTLALVGCVGSVPDCLPALTTLRSLTVDGSNLGDLEEADVSAGLAVALPLLTQLTRLELALLCPASLACLDALVNLRWLCWFHEPGMGDLAVLPPGSWLRQLRTLAAPPRLVARSLAALSGATSLEQLCIYSSLQPAYLQLRAIIGWAAQHAPLQQLLLGSQDLPGSVWGDAAAASHLRPSLSILPSTIDHPDFE